MHEESKMLYDKIFFRFGYMKKYRISPIKLKQFMIGRTPHDLETTKFKICAEQRTYIAEGYIYLM